MDDQILNDSPLLLLGFGAQGQAEARNLKKSGVAFKLLLRENGPSFKTAQAEGFEVQPLNEPLKSGETVAVNLPDQVQKSVYETYLKGRDIKRLVFAHGFNTHFKLIEKEEEGPTHCLVAPKGAASGLEEFYGSNYALPAILSVENSRDEKNDRAWCEAYARAIGCHSKGLVWASFKDETECDLFSEQAFLCGGLSKLLQTTYEVLTEAGYNKETAYFETLYELKLIVDLVWKKGLNGMRDKISPTALFGDLTRGERVIDSTVKENMKSVLQEIQEGKFTREFLETYGDENFESKKSAERSHPIETVGKTLREKIFEN